MRRSGLLFYLFVSMCKKKATGDGTGEGDGIYIASFVGMLSIDTWILFSVVLALFYLLGFQAAFWQIVFRSNSAHNLSPWLQDFSIQEKKPAFREPFFKKRDA